MKKNWLIWLVALLLLTGCNGYPDTPLPERTGGKDAKRNVAHLWI